MITGIDVDIDVDIDVGGLGKRALLFLRERSSSGNIKLSTYVSVNCVMSWCGFDRLICIFGL